MGAFANVDLPSSFLLLSPLALLLLLARLHGHPRSNKSVISQHVTRRDISNVTPGVH